MKYKIVFKNGMQMFVPEEAITDIRLRGYAVVDKKFYGISISDILYFEPFESSENVVKPLAPSDYNEKQQREKDKKLDELITGV